VHSNLFHQFQNDNRCSESSNALIGSFFRVSRSANVHWVIPRVAFGWPALL
jgi:hypothetical protein